MIKHLELAGKVQIDWQHVLAEAYDAVMDSVETGTPIVRLPGVEDREGSKFRIEPIAFNGLPVIWFGRGGSGKSTLVAAAAISLHANIDLLGLPLIPGPVLICDWETDAQTYKEQIRLICEGHGIPMPDIAYRACMAPLVRESEEIGRFIEREGMENVFADSLGQACGGDKNSQEVTGAMFGAMRSWGTSNMLVDHIAKDEKTNTPYGSVYFENNARATWRAKGTMKGNEHFLSLELEKSNLGRFPSVYFRFAFLPNANQPEAITVERIDSKQMPSEIKATATCREALIVTFNEQRAALTVTDLVTITGENEKTIRNTLIDMEAKFEVTKVIIAKGANKYAKRSPRSDEGVGNGQRVGN